MSMMKAARLHSIGDFRVDNVETPTPKGYELLVKVGACGICGSDIPRIYEHGTSNQKYPMALGHEFSGTIVAVGEKADPALISKKGAFFPLIPCNICDPCLSGNYAMCKNYNYMGSRCDGGFAEYCLVPSAWNFVESLNPQTSLSQLAMLEPACVAQHAVRKSKIFPGANIVIFGAGPIGIMGGNWSRLAGGNVLFCDVVDSKVAFAKQKNFMAVNTAKEPLLEAVRQAFNGKLADIAIEGTGYGSALNQAIECLKPFGQIALLGNPASDTLILNKNHSMMLRKELNLCGVWNSHYNNMPINEWRYTVDMMNAGAFDCSDLISHTCSLDELPAMIESIRNKKIDSWKVMCLVEDI
jgi:L-iditol 2-dehydrogenase